MPLLNLHEEVSPPQVPPILSKGPWPARCQGRKATTDPTLRQLLGVAHQPAPFSPCLLGALCDYGKGLPVFGPQLHLITRARDGLMAAEAGIGAGQQGYR